MTHLLDTDICIYWLKGSRPVLERVKTVGLGHIAISTPLSPDPFGVSAIPPSLQFLV